MRDDGHDIEGYERHTTGFEVYDPPASIVMQEVFAILFLLLRTDEVVDDED